MTAAATHTLGIDFGTSNSAVAVVDGHGVARLVPMEGSAATLPTAVFFNAEDKTVHFGRDAIALYLATDPALLSAVSLEPILFRSDDTVFDADGLKKVKVNAKVVEHIRGKKLRVFKFKPKSGYKKTAGHRQELTRLEIVDITGGAKKAAAKKTDAEKKES